MTKISYPSLTEEQKNAVHFRLKVRRKIYFRFVNDEDVSTLPRVWVIGDRPGPSAPKDPRYLHTPFHSIWHCSGWLNAYLEVEGIPESSMVWINAYDKDGNPTPYPELLEDRHYICLGENAFKWHAKNPSYRAAVCAKIQHPQYWKRFKSSEPYPLIEWLRYKTLAKKIRPSRMPFDNLKIVDRHPKRVYTPEEMQDLAGLRRASHL